ncbi:guanylate kinase [Bosea sp. F3-2]|uniref:guanylate kinase n=1 Tax=Bosea sp. F3-2 TaxID=2599640 RepID=UPI0011EC6828|nr:guanylate kinase [Bosea sp. F3-2]QEL21511.1 guanylate kinase [Bosea sp. F3-2]
MAETTRPARRGLMLILSSPSGAGKSTLTRNLCQRETNIDLSVSVTTRERRASEIDGVHYRFIDRDTFEALRDHDDLLEWAEVHGNCYGTPRKPVEAALARGRDVLFDIDWQGTMQIVDKAREDVVTIFILPPSMAELRSRLVRRAEDAPEVIAKRLANARSEIARWEKYDYVIVNDDLNDAYDSIKAILTAERLKRGRAIGLADFVETLLDETMS